MSAPPGAWHPLPALLAFTAALLAGVINAIAGGGSLLTFPTLIWLGLPPVLANATNTVAVWPASLSSAWGFREELRSQRRRWLWLIVPALLGGALGAALLRHTPPGLFRTLAPWLVLCATLLVGAEPLLRRLHAQADGSGHRTGRLVVLGAAQLGIAIYGGFFGIGIGLLMLALYALARLGEIRLEIGVKNACATVINGAAVVYFIFHHMVVWHAALTMGAGALLGGILGAAVAHRVDRTAVRYLVVGIGVAVTAALFAWAG